MDEPYTRCVSDSIYARYSHLGWIISGYVLENGEDYQLSECERTPEQTLENEFGRLSKISIHYNRQTFLGTEIVLFPLRLFRPPD